MIPHSAVINNLFTTAHSQLQELIKIFFFANELWNSLKYVPVNMCLINIIHNLIVEKATINISREVRVTDRLSQKVQRGYVHVT